MATSLWAQQGLNVDSVFSGLIVPKSKLTVTTPKPAVTTQPKATTVTAGKTATIKVVATNVTKYQWQYKMPGATSWKNCGEKSAKTATGTSITSSSAQPTETGTMLE